MSWRRWTPTLFRPWCPGWRRWACGWWCGASSQSGCSPPCSPGLEAWLGHDTHWSKMALNNSSYFTSSPDWRSRRGAQKPASIHRTIHHLPSAEEVTSISYSHSSWTFAFHSNLNWSIQSEKFSMTLLFWPWQFHSIIYLCTITLDFTHKSCSHGNYSFIRIILVIFLGLVPFIS